MGEFVIHTSDGLRLSAFDWPSNQNPSCPSAVIILIHGLAEYSGRYDHFAQFYNENDIAVVSMDLRGHGLSEGKHSFVPTVEAVFSDIDRLIKKTRSRYRKCPAILYGHSMGGNLALSYTLNRYGKASDKPPYQAIVVTSPYIRLHGHLQLPRPVNSFVRAVGLVRPSLKIPLRFNSRILSRSANVVDAYNDDPHIRRSITLSLARSLGETAKMLDRTACTFHIPVLIQHGDADSLTCHNASQRFANRGKNTEFKSWPFCYHELHHEPERDEIFHFTLDWIREKTNLSH